MQIRSQIFLRHLLLEVMNLSFTIVGMLKCHTGCSRFDMFTIIENRSYGQLKYMHLSLWMFNWNKHLFFNIQFYLVCVYISLGLWLLHLNVVSFRYFQSGFHPLDSTETVLVKITNDFLMASLCILVLLDLSAAFDTNSHNIPLDRLTSISITDIPFAWFRSYLSDLTPQKHEIRLLSSL